MAQQSYSEYARAFAARCERPTCPAALRLGELLFELREGSQTVAKRTVELTAEFTAGWRLAQAA